MRPSLELESALGEARRLHAQGRLEEAERVYRQLAATAGAPREEILEALAELYRQSRRAREYIETLTELTRVAPDRLRHFVRLAGVLDGLGQTDAAIGQYRRLLERQPGMAAAHYNVALLYRKNKQYARALAHYERAVRLGIDRVQEVYSNMGVLYSEMRAAAKAREMFERALGIDPQYVPAMFNLAGLLEEAGEREPAIELYRRILAIEPRHWDSLARIAHARRVTEADGELLDSLRRAIDAAADDPSGREVLGFALGKALDDLGRHEEALAAYRAANELGRARNRPYDRAAVERAFDRLMEVFDPQWVKSAASGSVASPIFICGMFRSGTTLVERILAAHPAVTAGGELDFLPWLVSRRLSPYPQRVRSAPLAEVHRVGEEYLAKVGELFPGARHVTDKRPDNFLHIGLIKVLFPAARIVRTRRDPLDNCLSVYFQPLGGDLNYATDLADIAHYYAQHERLMAHWSACFGEDLLTVDYDELVRSPEPVVRRLLDFLGLEWDDRCLRFQEADGLVKTASIWQVREPLHARSSGRWRSYAPFLPELEALQRSLTRPAGP